MSEDLSKWWENLEIPLNLTESDNEFLDFYFPEIKGKDRELGYFEVSSKSAPILQLPVPQTFWICKTRHTKPFSLQQFNSKFLRKRHRSRHWLLHGH